jgi:hypothetical protein
MLWSRVRVLRCRPRVAVTATPSGSSGIELEHMEHAVDPSRCATNVPQGHCSGAVPADHEGGPKPLTCANTAWRRRARTDDLRIQNEQTACPLARWHKMCHLLVMRDGSGSSEEVCRPLTCTNTSGPRRARTDDLRIKRAIWVCGLARILLISCVIASQRLARRGGGSHARAD